MKRSARILQKGAVQIPIDSKTRLRKAQCKEKEENCCNANTNTSINDSGLQLDSNLTSPYFNNKRLCKEFYQQDSIELSQNLLGKVLARRLPHGEILRGTIVETEAYPGTNIDPASHSYRGKITERNKAMFMEPGTSYVYIIHGIYHCFNISAKGEGSVCLIRAVEPLEDYESMHNFRQQYQKKKVNLPSPESTPTPQKKSKDQSANEHLPVEAASSSTVKKPLKTYDLAKGPGKLCIAFNIRRDICDTLDLTTSDELWLEYSEDPTYNNKDSFEIEVAKRVGIESTPLEARDKLWRFFVKDNFSVSTAKPSLIKKALAKK